MFLAAVAALVPLAACGSFSFDFPLPDGGDQSEQPAPPVVAENPLLTSVIPNVGTIAGGTKVTLVGQNFAAGMEVLFGGFLGFDVTVIDANTLTVMTPSVTATFMSGWMSICSRPLGPFTATPVADWVTSTPFGTGRGSLPIRDTSASYQM